MDEKEEEGDLVQGVGEGQADIHTLFTNYNEVYFGGSLGSTCVEWSDRMTLCAGICYLRGGTGARHCVIRLSRPILQYRPYADVLSTLLHEMIHAYLWIHSGLPDRDGHGEAFQRLAARINDAERGTGVSVTIYHAFHAEVAAHRQHIWRCQGPCREWPPYFGYVRRAMNRAPQPADRWWGEHQRICGGTYVKLQEPERSGRGRPQGPIGNSINKAITLSNSSIACSKNVDYFMDKGRAHFARDLDQPAYQCPCCESYWAKDLDTLNGHLDGSCLGRSEESTVNGEDGLELMQACPVCGLLVSNNLTRLKAHIEDCLDDPAPVGDGREIIDLT